jgi:F-type H+-transporting ATPase subunit gamma
VAGNLKQIRKRIANFRTTQKTTRAMKLVSGARLNRAQQRILALRPYAIKVQQVLAETTEEPEQEQAGGEPTVAVTDDGQQPLLVRRPRKNVMLLVLTSDRGLCGAFNTNIGKAALRAWREGEAAGQKVQMAVIGRKGRDFLRRREAPVVHVFSNIWERIGLEATREVAHTLLKPFLAGEVDAIQLVYNEFKSAMSQRVVVEPSRTRLLARLVPMYLEVTLLRALYESQASEFGARMTAMDAATKNAKEMIDKLTLLYNRARQATITTELMEIIGGANALAG